MNNAEINQLIHTRLGLTGELKDFTNDPGREIWKLVDSHVTTEGWEVEIVRDKKTKKDIGTEFTLWYQKRPYKALAPIVEMAICLALVNLLVAKPDFKPLVKTEVKEDEQLALF